MENLTKPTDNVTRFTRVWIGTNGGKENMMSKRLTYLTSVVVVALVLGGVAWAAHDVTAPGDIIQGVPNDGISTANTNGWPGNEAPNQAIDNQTGTKFLHFKGEVEPTGIRVTPKAGPTVVTGIRLCSANDATERSPVQYELSGSNDSIDGPYTLIAKGDIVDFTAAAWPFFTWNTTPIQFTNTVSYKHYQLMFPKVRDPASANSMQIAEIELTAPDLKAYAPNPAKGAVITMPLFQWTKGDTAMFHNVYLGTSANLTDADLRQKNSPLAMYYHVLPMDPGVTYYWRVDEVEPSGNVIKGDVWSVMMAPKKAYNPLPLDGNKWLPLNQQLSWIPGAGAIQHDLYFGTDKAAVESRSASVSKGTMIAPTYDPKALQANTTYYWAVDETAAGVKYAGSVWSFTTVGAGGGVRGEYFVGTNPAGIPALTRIDKGIDVSLTGTTSPGAPIPGDGWSARWTADLEIAVTDTYMFSLWCQDGTRMWIDGQLVIDKWVVPTVTSEYFTLPLDLEKGIHALRVEYFDSGGDAIEQLRWSTATMAKVTVPVGPLQPPAHAQSVYPLNKAVDVEQDVTLMWSAGYKAKQHDVYFGADKTAVANATPKTAGVYVGRQALNKVTYDPGTLDWNKTYYWRIDEVNDADAASPWAGMVWSFTTANFLVIDNMEGYTDDPGNEIFSTWIDGFADNFKSSTSTVGNATAPFAEQTNVRGGKQSLPMTYDNTKAPYFGETVREFSPLADWTVNGINTLLVCVRGLVTNGATPVYVVVEDSAGKSAVVANADTSVVTKGTWTEWKIPLSQFTGVNLAKVKKLYLGVGDRKATKAAGTGKVYVDDIGVIKQ